VDTDKLRIQLPVQEFYPAGAEGEDQQSRAPARHGVQRPLPVEIAGAEALGEDPVLQLDLRGLRYEEAMARLERQIDNAIVRGLGEFHVIHGKGQGILQEGVHRFLAGHDAVADYHFARPEEGGFGNTVVQLKN
jgi:DNA mismatch repair protein MutS2